MKKISMWKRIGMAVMATALVSMFASCGNPVTGSDDDDTGDKTEEYSLKVSESKFEPGLDDDKNLKPDEDGNYTLQAQFSIFDTTKKLPVKGDKISVKLEGESATAIDKDNKTYVFLAASTDGKLQSGKDNNWWAVLIDEADYGSMTIDGKKISIEKEFTLTDGCPSKSTMQWGTEENGLMLVFGYTEPDEADAVENALTISKLEVKNLH